jgi:hypothetical protein
MTRFGSCWSYLVTAGLAASLPACAGVTGEDYKGTALATLGGVVTSDPGAPTRDIAAAVVWMPKREWFVANRDGTLSNMGDGAAMGTLVDVEGEFPASFQISIYEPPPAIAHNDSWDETSFFTAEGRVVAVDRALVVDNGDGTVDLRNALIGSSDQIDGRFETTQFVLWYLSDDAREGWKPAFKTKGYHLLQSNGQLTCQLFPSYEECVTVVTQSLPDLRPDVVDTFCRSPHQIVGGGFDRGGGGARCDGHPADDQRVEPAVVHRAGGLRRLLQRG